MYIGFRSGFGSGGRNIAVLRNPNKEAVVVS